MCRTIQPVGLLVPRQSPSHAPLRGFRGRPPLPDIQGAFGGRCKIKDVMRRLAEALEIFRLPDSRYFASFSPADIPHLAVGSENQKVMSGPERPTNYHCSDNTYYVKLYNRCR